VTLFAGAYVRDGRQRVPPAVPDELTSVLSRRPAVRNVRPGRLRVRRNGRARDVIDSTRLIDPLDRGRRAVAHEADFRSDRARDLARLHEAWTLGQFSINREGLMHWLGRGDHSYVMDYASAFSEFWRVS
jgi:hypothetical protein